MKLKINTIFILSLCFLLFTFSSTTPVAKITESQLGEKLFFDPILSSDKSISCASCHIPAFAFADTVALSKGVGGVLGKRNAPSVMNMSSRDLLFYDGRAKDLENQVHFPIEDKKEMQLAYDIAIQRLNQNKKYIAWFYTVYKSKPTKKNVAKAIAAFERTLETSNTPFDDYMNGKIDAISPSAIRGRELFMSSKTKCFDCHFSPDFTGDEFRNIGLYDGKTWNDAGRFEITKDSSDMGKFKVPGLRNVAVTAPYMHNGSMKTLQEVIEYYDNPFLKVKNPINIDTLMQKPLGLTAQEKTDLEAFLITLTDRRFNKTK